jgi:hypothetical protein
MTVQPGRDGRGQRQLVSGDVIGVCVRDEATRLTAADVDAELSAGQEESGVVVEHAGQDFGLRISDCVML